MGAPARLLSAVSSYARLAWWGLVAPRIGAGRSLVVVQAVVLSAEGVLLAVREDLRGWELPGGGVRPGESEAEALRREVEEETGLRVAVECHVGDYVRTGFGPHTARVYRCRVEGGALRASPETPRVRWFQEAEIPTTLFPWFRPPLEDALGVGSLPAIRREHHGLRAILAGLWIDLRMRMSGDRAR